MSSWHITGNCGRCGNPCPIPVEHKCTPSTSALQSALAIAEAKVEAVKDFAENAEQRERDAQDLGSFTTASRDRIGGYSYAISQLRELLNQDTEGEKAW